MSNNSFDMLASPVLNPLTPMGFLPPQFAISLTLLRYVFVGTLGAVVWDTIMCIGDDYHLLRDFKITPPTIVYFFSRIVTLTYFILGAIVSTAPIGNCSQVFTATVWFFAVAVPSTTLLFFFRVRAVYLDNKYVVGAFAVMWLGAFAACITATQKNESTRIGPTNYCLSSSLSTPSVFAAAILPLIHDTLGFFAITWRLTTSARVKPTFKTSFKVLAFGHYLPAFSRALLKDGQKYFLGTIIVYIFTVMRLYIKDGASGHWDVQPYGAILGHSNVAIMNAMAARLYRNTKLGRYRPPAISGKSATTPIVFDVEEPRDAFSRKIEEDQGEDNCDVFSEGGSSYTKLQRVKGESGLNGPSEKGDTMV